jgi:hypothetical protein
MRPLLAAGLLIAQALVPPAAPAASELTLAAVPLGAVRPEAAALLLSGVEGGTLPASLSAVPQGAAPPGEPSRVLLLLELDRDALLEGHEAPVLGLEVAVYAVDREGAVVDLVSEGARLELGNDRRLVAARPWLYATTLQLPAGPVSIRAYVRLRRSGDWALRRLDFEMPLAQPLLTAEIQGDAPLVITSARVAAVTLSLGRPAGSPPPGAVGGAGAEPPATGDIYTGEGAPTAGEPAPERIRGELAGSLRRFAQGDRRGALAALRALEREAQQRDRRRAFQWLDQAEQEIFSQVAAHQPEALLAIASLYREWFGIEVRAGRTGSARRLELTSARLLQTLAAVGDPHLQVWTAEAYRLFAAQLVRAQVPLRALAWLEAATQLAGPRPEDLLARGILLERLGYDTAAQGAYALVANENPASREADLRQAILASKRGDGAARDAHLDRVIADPASDWISALAFQERVRALLDRRQTAPAIRALEEGLGRHPEDPGLATLLAFLYERTGRRADAFVLVERLHSTGAAWGVSPRRRYADWPVGLLEAAAAEHEKEAMMRLHALAQILGAPEELSES